MADSDKTLKIEIITVANTAGVTQASQGVNKLKEALEDSAKSAEQSKAVHEGLNRLFRLLGQETAPELGEALEALGKGPAGALLIVGAALEFVQRKAAEAAAAIQASFDAARESGKGAIDAANELYEALEKASHPADALKTAFESQRTVLGEMEGQHKHILEDIEKELIAEANGDKAKIEQIKAYMGLQKESFSIAVEMRKLNEGREQQASRQAAQPGLKKSAQDLASQISAATTDPAVIAAQNAITEDKKKYGDNAAGMLSEKANDLGDARADLAEARAAAANDMRLAPAAAAAKARVEQDEAAKKALDAYNNNTAIVDANTALLKDLNKLHEAAIAKAAENLNAITEGSEKNRVDKQKFFAGVAGSDLDKAIQLAMRAGAGAKLNPAEETFERTIGTLIAGHDVTAAVAEKMFQAASKNQQIQESFMNRLLTAVEKLSDFSKFEARMQKLESRFSNQPPPSSTPLPTG